MDKRTAGNADNARNFWDAREGARHDGTLSRRKHKRAFARFHHLYESRDGGLCLFEDESGHLQAVDSSRLA